MAPALGLVPRAIWPSKPIQVSGYQFNQEYFGQSATIYSSSAVTPIADFYRYGGWLVVVLGMFLFGAALRAVDLVVRIEDDPRMLYVLLALFPLVIKWESDMVSLISGLIMGFIAAAVAARIAFVANPDPTSASR